jgi:hypothetical protein
MVLGEVEVGRHVEARSALEVQLLHGVAALFEPPSDDRLQGRPLGEGLEPDVEVLLAKPGRTFSNASAVRMAGSTSPSSSLARSARYFRMTRS